MNRGGGKAKEPADKGTFEKDNNVLPVLSILQFVAGKGAQHLPKWLEEMDLYYKREYGDIVNISKKLQYKDYPHEEFDRDKLDNDLYGMYKIYVGEVIKKRERKFEAQETAKPKVYSVIW